MNPVDDDLYGNLTHEQYLLERRREELKGINQWKIEPTDPSPNKELIYLWIY